MPAAYKRIITRKKNERKMEFEMFHDPIGAFRRKADYNYDAFSKVMLFWEDLLNQEYGFNYYGITIISPVMAQRLLARCNN